MEKVLGYAHLPSPDWYDYSVIRPQAEALHSQGRTVAFMGDRLNRIAELKPAMYLAGGGADSGWISRWSGRLRR